MEEIKCRLLVVSVLYSVWLQQHSLYIYIAYRLYFLKQDICSRLIWKKQQEKQYSTVFPADVVKNVKILLIS